MMKTSRLVLATAALVVAFTVSVTYQLGSKGWHFELHPEPSQARALGGNDVYEFARLEVLAAVLHKVHNEYVDPARVRSKTMLLEALQEVQRRIPEVIVRPGPGEPEDDPASLEVMVGPDRKIFDLAEIPSIFVARHRLQSILRFVGEHVSDPDVEPRDVEYAAIDGMLSTLDPHSVHMRPETFSEMKVSTRGSFGGLGIVISIREGELTIISPIEDTPASRAGLKGWDKIVRINDESTVNMPLQDAVDRLRGKINTTVTIWVRRKGWSTPRKYVLRRAKIEIRSVESQVLEGGVGYIKLKAFQENTTQHLRQHLEQIREKLDGQQMKGLVLDLRNNPGGLLGQAIRVSDLFLDSGPIVSTVAAGNKGRDVKEATWRGTEERYPIAVLTNNGSASASEIVAGALKNQDRAVVLGQQSFGKGSVQVLYTLPDQSALKLTVAQYLTPGDVSIQSVGIVPDVVLVPVRIDKDDVDYFAGDQGIREADLDEHLTNEAARAESRPAYTLHYFKATEPEPEEGAEEEVDETKKPFEPDFEILMARDLVVDVPGNANRREVLKGAAGLFGATQQREDARIAEALGGLGVDWAAAPTADSDNLPLVALTTSAAGGVVTAGDTLELTATVTNRGKTPLDKLRAVTDSESHTLDDLEFVFGLVPPGESRSWTVPLTIPKDEEDRMDEVRLTTHRGDAEEELTSTAFLLRTEALPKPHFAWSWQLDDAEGGNGDGLLQRGETAHLLLHVTNRGAGPSLDTMAKLNLDSDVPRRFVDLKKGRETLSELPVGERKTARFEVAVRPGLEGDTFKAEFSLADVELREGAVEEIDIPVVRTATKTSEMKGAARVKNTKGAELYAACDATSDVLGKAPAGTWMAVERKCGSWYRVASGDRTAYVPAADVKAYKNKKPRADGPEVAWVTHHETPRIELDASVVATHRPSAESLHLRGRITDDEALSDYSVYVHTRSGRKTRSRKIAYVPSGRGANARQLDLDREVPLFEGLNRVVVVARDASGLTVSRTLVVHRRPLGSAAPALVGIELKVPTEGEQKTP